MAALDTYNELFNLLEKDLIYEDTKYKDKIKNLLSFCHELRFYACFKFLANDSNNFLKYKQGYVSQLRNDYYAINSKNTFFDSSQNQKTIYLKMAIVDLLFSDNFNKVVLLDKRQNFCNLYDEFVITNQPYYQALSILGLALISAYENNISMLYQGFNQAKNLYSPLSKLVETIEYSLSLAKDFITKKDSLLKNPFSNFIINQEEKTAPDFSPNEVLKIKK